MHARLAVDALIGVNVKHLFTFAKTVARTNDYTIRVLAAKTGGRDNECHNAHSLPISLRTMAEFGPQEYISF